MKRLVLLLPFLACSSSQTNSLPDVRAPERGPNDAGGDVADAGEPPDEDGSTVTLANCTNGRRDGDETDVDCGGPACSPCASGKTCALRRDCASLVCGDDKKCTADIGCSDGTREGFASVASFPNIAACAGAWSLGGVLATTSPACTRLSGNTSSNPSGAGCSVADLCQPGWHMCLSPADVAAKSGGAGCGGGGFAGSQFFATRQSGGGFALCDNGGANDLFGCGDVGDTSLDPTTCAPLDRASGDLCASLPTTWSCGADGTQEAAVVVKTGSDGGGVLCCRD